MSFNDAPPRAAGRQRFLRLLDARGVAAASCIWLGTFSVMTVFVVRGGTAIPYGAYAAAGARWLAQARLYETQTIDGFQYLPPSAWVFSAFTRMGSPLGDCVWRALGCSLFAWALYRASKSLLSRHTGACFFVATCACVGPVASNLGNGQANLWLGALTLHVAVDLAAQRWTRAALILALGLALKPLMIVLLLLVCASYRPMTWRGPLAVLLVFGSQFCAYDPAWLAEQYASCWTKLSMCAKPDRLFEDVRSLASVLGWSISHESYLFVRAAAAVAVWMLTWRARARVREPYASLLIGALSASYLVLFNPRTLSTSYVMTAAFAGPLIALYTVRRRDRKALLLCVLSVCWGFSAGATALGVFRNWLKPAAGGVFLGLLAAEICGLTYSLWPRGLRLSASHRRAGLARVARRPAATEPPVPAALSLPR